jgi:hypothetical protein
VEEVRVSSDAQLQPGLELGLDYIRFSHTPEPCNYTVNLHLIITVSSILILPHFIFIPIWLTKHSGLRKRRMPFSNTS